MLLARRERNGSRSKRKEKECKWPDTQDHGPDDTEAAAAAWPPQAAPALPSAPAAQNPAVRHEVVGRVETLDGPRNVIRPPWECIGLCSFVLLLLLL